MHVTRFDDAAAFRDRVLPYLLPHEAEHNLMISIILRLANDTERWGEDPPVLCAVDDGSKIVGVATQTPPYKLVLSEMPVKAVGKLVAFLQQTAVALPGMMGPRDVAAAFATVWASGAGAIAHPEQQMRIYQLDAVMPPPQPSGYASMATEEDLDWLTDCWRMFFAEVEVEEQRNIGDLAQRAIAEGRVWLWRDPLPVATVTYCGPTPHGMRISNVYTLPATRQGGYGTALTAAVSNHLLGTGRRFCYLYTNLANPISNSIYQKIGYRPVSDVDAYQFEPTAKME